MAELYVKSETKEVSIITYDNGRCGYPCSWFSCLMSYAPAVCTQYHQKLKQRGGGNSQYYTRCAECLEEFGE